MVPYSSRNKECYRRDSSNVAVFGNDRPLSAAGVVGLWHRLRGCGVLYNIYDRDVLCIATYYVIQQNHGIRVLYIAIYTAVAATVSIIILLSCTE